MPASQGSQPSALDLSHIQRKSTSAGVDLLTRLTSSGTASSSRNTNENSDTARPGPPSRLDSGASSTSQQQYRRGSNAKQKSYSSASRSKSSRSTANLASAAKDKAKASGGSFGADVAGLFGHIQVGDEDMDSKPSAWEEELDRLLGVGGSRTKAKGKAKSSANRSRKVVRKDDTIRSMGRDSMMQKSNSFSAPSGIGLSDADKGRKRSLSLEREMASKARHGPNHTRVPQHYHRDVHSHTNKSTMRSEHPQEHISASRHRDPSENPEKQTNPSRGMKRAAEDPPDESLQHPYIRAFQFSERPEPSSDALFDSLFDYSDDDNHPPANLALKRLHALRNGPRTGPKTYKPLHDAPFEVDVAKKKTGQLELEPFPTMRMSPHVPAFSSPSPPPPTSRELLRSRSARNLYPHSARDEPEAIDISDDDDAPSALAPVGRETCKSHSPETIDLSNAEEYGDLDLGSDDNNDVIDLT